MSAKSKPTRRNRRKKRNNQDLHRWRKVAVALLSVLFFVPFTKAFYVHGAFLIWCAVASTILLLCLALVLLEWHVWKRNVVPGRVGLLVLSGLIVAGGFWAQRRLPMPSPPRRAWLRLSDEEMRAFVASLSSQTEPRSHVRLGCPAANEDTCVLAAPFLNAFKRGHFFVENDRMERVILSTPTSGVVVSSYGHADAYDPQDPDQGKWVEQTTSLSTIEDAFAAIGIKTGASADESLPKDVITIYFGIEPDERTEQDRALRRQQRQEAEEEIKHPKTP